MPRESVPLDDVIRSMMNHVTLNTINSFWYFLAPFINIVKGIAINSFIFNNTGISYIEIIKP